MGAGQGLQITFVGRMGDLGAAVKVGHPFTQLAPSQASLGVSFLGPKDFEVPGIVDGRLYPEIGPLLIVELDMIASHPMLDPDAFGAFLQMADDFAGKGRGDVSPGGNLSPQKAHHIRAGKGCQAVPQKMGIDLSQLLGVLEEDVGGPLALINRSVVW